MNRRIDLSKLTDHELEERIAILLSSIESFEKDDPMLPFFQNHLQRHQEEQNRRKARLN